MLVTSRTTDARHITSAYRLADLEVDGRIPRGTLRLVRDVGAPMPWAVWCEDEILGAGRTPGVALADAQATVRGWAP